MSVSKNLSLSQLSVHRVILEHVLASPSVTVSRLGLVFPEFPFLSDSGTGGPQGTLGGRDAASLTSGRRCLLWDGLGPVSPCRYCKFPLSASLSPHSTVKAI